MKKVIYYLSLSLITLLCFSCSLGDEKLEQDLVETLERNTFLRLDNINDDFAHFSQNVKERGNKRNEVLLFNNLDSLSKEFTKVMISLNEVSYDIDSVNHYLREYRKKREVVRNVLMKYDDDLSFVFTEDSVELSSFSTNLDRAIFKNKMALSFYELTQYSDMLVGISCNWHFGPLYTTEYTVNKIGQEQYEYDIILRTYEEKLPEDGQIELKDIKINSEYSNLKIKKVGYSFYLSFQTDKATDLKFSYTLKYRFIGYDEFHESDYSTVLNH